MGNLFFNVEFSGVSASAGIGYEAKNPEKKTDKSNFA